MTPYFDDTYPPTKSVLTIQSHVVHGYVGNRTSTFPLQLLGWDADVLNTVQLSNHTGYGQVHGQKLAADEIWVQYEGLRRIDMPREYDAVLTGYVPAAQGTATVGKIAADIVAARRACGAPVLWVLDPVIGDNGRYYVSQDVIPVYRDLLRSGAVSVVTPNQFEAETLTGITIRTRADVLRVLDVFHRDYGVPHVVLTSMKLDNDDSHILSVGSSLEEKDSTPRVFFYRYPSLDAYITGTGDLFAALLVDRLHKHTELARDAAARSALVAAAQAKETKTGGTAGDAGSAKYTPLAFALGEVLGVVQAVIRRTLSNPALRSVRPGEYGNVASMKVAELKLVQSQDLIPGTDIPYAVEEFSVEQGES